MSSNPKFLVDVGVGNVVEAWLESEGFDVIAVRNIDPKMTDVQILKIAENQNRAVITMDKDFGELVFNRKKEHKGVLLLRLTDSTSDEKLAVVREIFDGYLDELSGNFCVYQNQTLRIR